MNDDFLLPFLTTFRENPDYNSADEVKEAQSLIRRNQAIEEYFSGQTFDDYLFDLLAEEGVEPSDYVCSVEEDIEYLSANPHLLY